MDELELLGTGGYATVHLCRRKADNALVALKRIPVEKLASSLQQERLRTEQLILTTVASPFLCHTASLQEQDQQDSETRAHHSIAMEFIDGKPLYQCIWRYKDRSGRLTERIAKFFAAQVVLALRTLHTSGFVHRDLKSGNVLIDTEGFAKVIDFGLAKQLSAPEQRAKSFCGTHYIMAPEIFTRGSYGFAVDWWSLGVVIYEMVVGCPPWAYKPTPGAPLDAYFESVTQIGARLHTHELVVSANDDPTSMKPSPSPPLLLSDEIQSLLRGLLTMDPEQRLGSNSAAEVMAHPWFDGVDWGILEAKGTHQSEIVIPYSLQTDFVDDLALISTALVSAELELSSAESIDPEDDVRYFADF